MKKLPICSIFFCSFIFLFHFLNCASLLSCCCCLRALLVLLARAVFAAASSFFSSSSFSGSLKHSAPAQQQQHKTKSSGRKWREKKILKSSPKLQTPFSPEITRKSGEKYRQSVAGHSRYRLKVFSVRFELFFRHYLTIKRTFIKHLHFVSHTFWISHSRKIGEAAAPWTRVARRAEFGLTNKLTHAHNQTYTVVWGCVKCASLWCVKMKATHKCVVCESGSGAHWSYGLSVDAFS